MHFIQKCSCGAVISQCRCPDPNKVVRIEDHGCIVCQQEKAIRLLQEVGLPVKEDS